MSKWTKDRIKDLNRVNLEDVSDGGLLLTREDLNAGSLVLEELDDELRRRGYGDDADFSDVKDQYFNFPPNRRRFPGPAQYNYQRAKYLVAKYAIPASWVFAIPVIGPLNNNEGWAMAVFMFPLFAWILVMFVFGWINFGGPPKIVSCLRPFDDRKLSVPLKRFLRKYLGFRAHTYTLADKGIKANTAMSIGSVLSPFVGIISVLLGGALAAGALFLAMVSPWIRQSLRVLKLGAPSAFVHVDKQLEKSVVRSAQQTFSGGTPFNIKCPHNGWRPCVQYLAHKSDVIVIDLSNIGPSVGWELGYIKARDLLGKCVFVCQQGREVSKSALAQLGLGNPVVYAYSAKGLLDQADDAEASFQQAVVAAAR
ncbi:hypothetical protein [Hyphomonas johnsonii]|nr:hypothetical protein [Hyphomonas johnsonii]